VSLQEIEDNFIKAEHELEAVLKTITESKEKYILEGIQSRLRFKRGFIAIFTSFVISDKHIVTYFLDKQRSQ